MDDSSCNGNATQPRGAGCGNFNARHFVIAAAAFEAKPSARDVFTDDDIVLKATLADTPGVAHLDSHVLAPVFGGSGRGEELQRRSKLDRSSDGFGHVKIVGNLPGSSLPES